MIERWRYLLALTTLILAIPLTETLVGHPIAARQPLHTIPVQLGGWTASTQDLEVTLAPRDRPNDYIHRRYIDVAGRTLTLYVGYYARESSRAQTHAICLGGCEVLDTTVERIEVPGGRISVNRVLVRENGVQSVVLYWYQQGPHVVQDPFGAKLSQLRRAFIQQRSDGALIRTTAIITSSADEAHARATDFVELFYPVLRSIFPD